MRVIVLSRLTRTHFSVGLIDSSITKGEITFFYPCNCVYISGRIYYLCTLCFMFSAWIALNFYNSLLCQNLHHTHVYSIFLFLTSCVGLHFFLLECRVIISCCQSFSNIYFIDHTNDHILSFLPHNWKSNKPFPWENLKIRFTLNPLASSEVITYGNKEGRVINFRGMERLKHIR